MFIYAYNNLGLCDYYHGDDYDRGNSLYHDNLYLYNDLLQENILKVILW